MTARARPPVVDVVIPVRNEAACLERNLRTAHAALRRERSFAARIIVADNGSDDRTPEIAARLSSELDGVMLLRVAEPGRGRALRRAWLASTADVVAYMYADLSTDLSALPTAVDEVVSGRSPIVVGSRLAPGARVRRGLRRELISRCYNLLLRMTLHVRFRDAQCGFKVLSASVARQLMAHVADQQWFFDTELLVTAERMGLRVHELPVAWVEDPKSSVRIVRTALQDVGGIARLLRDSRARRAPALSDQLARFAAIGVASTAGYLGLFDVLRALMPAAAANAIALIVCGVANTLANRRYTFGIRGVNGVRRALLAGTVTFAVALALTSISLFGLHAADAGASAPTSDMVLLVASAAATLMRFTLLRQWVGRPALVALTTPSQHSHGVATRRWEPPT